MAEVQTTYDETLAPGYPGMVVNGETSNRISRTVEKADGIAFGNAAFRSSDTGIDETAAAANFLGFVLADQHLGLVGGETPDVVKQYESATIITLGSLLVTVGEDVTDGAQVYVTGAGAIVDTSTGNQIAAGWFFDQTVANGGLCRISKR